MGIDQLSELHIYDKPLGGIIGRCACEINPPTKMDVGVLNIFFLSSFWSSTWTLAGERSKYKKMLFGIIFFVFEVHLGMVLFLFSN